MKQLIFILLLIPIACFGQNVRMTDDSIPVENGKVVFSREYFPNMTKEQIHAKIKSNVEGAIVKNGGMVVNPDDSISGLMVFKVLDYLEMQKNNWSVFAFYMQYIYAFEYKDNYCKASIRNIRYVELEEMNEVSSGNKKLSEMDSFPGEFILVDKKYKRLTVKDASNKIITKTLERVDEIFDDEIVF